MLKNQGLSFREDKTMICADLLIAAGRIKLS